MKRAVMLLAAAACFASAGFLFPAHAEDSPGSGFYGYALRGQSQAIQLTEDEPSANSHPEAEADLPQSQVSLASGVGYALSSVAWPGALLGNAGSLVLLVQPNAPSQVALLNDPVRAEARTGSAQHSATNDTVPGAHMGADATLAKTTADAKLDGGAAGAVLGFGTTTSSSVATLGSATGAATADSTAKDVSLANGVVKIGSVVSHAEGTTDGTTATAKGKTTVSGMTVAGVPVTVDDKGITVDTQHGDVPPTAVATVDAAVKQLGLTITLSDATQAKQGGSISYDAGSLLVLWKPPGSANTFTASLGGSRITAAASSTGASLVPPVPSGFTPVVTAAPPVPAGSVPAGGAPIGTGAAPGPPAVPAPTTAGVSPTSAGLEPIASGTPAPTWTVVLTIAGAALALGGLWRAPGLLLVEPRPVRCPLEEDDS